MLERVDGADAIEDMSADGVCDLSKGDRRDAGIDLFLEPVSFTKAIDGFTKDVRLRYIREIFEYYQEKSKRDLKSVLSVEPANHLRIL
jgi:hypothetical protein